METRLCSRCKFAVERGHLLRFCPRCGAEYEGGEPVPLTRLPRIEPTDLARRTALMARLLAMRPRSKEFPTDVEGFLRGVEDSLGLPVRFASAGPTYATKQEVSTSTLRTAP